MDDFGLLDRATTVRVGNVSFTLVSPVKHAPTVFSPHSDTFVYEDMTPDADVDEETLDQRRKAEREEYENILFGSSG